ncbi:AzlC family ABC transporter permease [Noviherbaspirillum pedocola]|uniref:AzlC family ABC transporter permease n=1 Tax=Noviherbaspirillum pedocola TaxID=2801341 RepID=A0A934VZR7_9BURK|nr:AzlC family ABC transporter permease [Noviherbaspirillum pedocola]MBK4733316.1 AzlC family ABC transporter permease [Noviherbaspirillum pedocola]
MPPDSTGLSAVVFPDPEKQAFRQATRDCAQAMPGIFAWAVVTGMAMMQSGLTLWQALGMNFIVFAGSAQLAALPLIAAGASPLLVLLTALAVNLRFVIFGASLGPHFAHLPWKKRLWYGYLNGDIVMGYFPQRYAEGGRPAGKAGYYMGICALNWIVWQAGSVAGILMASRIPASWGISFAGTLALLALLIPLVKNAAALSGVSVAGTVAVAGAALPYRLGLLGGVVAGMATALAVDALQGGEEK